MTATTRTINEMRIDVYARIAEACMVHGLPAPLYVDAADYGMTIVTIRLDDERPEQVDEWATFLGLPAATDTWYEPAGSAPWVGHKSQTWGGGWLGFRHLTVWCAIHDPEHVKRLSALAVLGA